MRSTVNWTIALFVREMRRVDAFSITKVAAVILKKTKETEEATKQSVEVSNDKKGKGAGKTSKKTRTVANIRDQSTADKEKQKRLDKKATEQVEEDEDLPTQAEIAASKPARKDIIIH